MEYKIPKRIIQTGKSKSLSPLEKVSVNVIKLLHPDFEYIYFDDNEVLSFMQFNFSQYIDIFREFIFPIQRVDFFRYCVVYKMGGFYLDLDVILSKALYDLLNSRCVFPFEELTVNNYLKKLHGMDWELGQYAFGAVPNHDFLFEIIENCVKAQKNKEWSKIMIKSVPTFFRREHTVYCSTGPGLVSRTFAENNHFADDINVLFPDDVCNRNNWGLFGEYGVHLGSGAWKYHSHSKCMYIIKKLHNLWMYRKREILIKDAAKLGKTRNKYLHCGDMSGSYDYKDKINCKV